MNQEIKVDKTVAATIEAAAGSLSVFMDWKTTGMKTVSDTDAVTILKELKEIEAGLTCSWNDKRPIRKVIAKVEAFVDSIPVAIDAPAVEPDAVTVEDGSVVEYDPNGLEIKFTAREQWLQAAVEIFKPWFDKREFAYPEKLRVACSLGSHGIKGKSIGQCWSTICSADSACEIMISPVLDDPSRVLDVLLHELCHAVLGLEEGHGPNFRALATDLGMTGKMTATIASPELVEELKPIIVQLGAYPHAALSAFAQPKKQTTRLIKLVCPSEDCGYTVRTTKKWLEVGFPTCPCGECMVDPNPVDPDEDEEGDDE